MKFKHIQVRIKKKPRKQPKKNNAHLVNKDKLFFEEKNLEQELVYRQPIKKKTKPPIKYY
jgi:hypothetical protein